MTPYSAEDLPQEDQQPERLSKSARKRAAHAAQHLGEALIGLREADLAALGLPERLAEAIREGRRIGSRAAGARQRQYIGKLMREIDPEPIRAALAARSERDAIETQLFRRAESWRERLITEGDSALEELARLRPGLDRASLRRQVASARHEHGSGSRTGRGGPAGRELFRALRALLG